MNVEQIVLTTFLVEIAEVFLQYNPTYKGSIYRMYSYYQKSPFLFFSTNVGYIWLLFVSIYYGVFNGVIILATTLKSIDIFTKIYLIQKLFIKRDLNYINQIEPIINAKTPSWVWFIGPLTYPYLIYIALI